MNVGYHIILSYYRGSLYYFQLACCAIYRADGTHDQTRTEKARAYMLASVVLTKIDINS